MDRNMDKVKEFYNKYKVYLTRQNLELLAVTVIVLSAILVFTSGIPGKGVLTLDQGKIKYDGTLVRGKMNGQGTMTFQNGDSYTGQFAMASLTAKGPLPHRLAGNMKGTSARVRPMDKEN